LGYSILKKSSGVFHRSQNINAYANKAVIFIEYYYWINSELEQPAVS